MTHTEDLVRAGSVLYRHGLVSAFGHVSCRTSQDSFAITPPTSLRRFTGDDVGTVPLTGERLPDGVPKEAWIHRAIYAVRPDVGAICRAQPPTTTALASAGVPIVPLHGQGSFLGAAVPVHPDPRLVRSQENGEALVRSLGESVAVVMRGNGAVTVGADIGQAVALMWLLEASADMNATAAAAGAPAALTEDEQDAWRAVAPELLQRIWLHLRQEEEQ